MASSHPTQFKITSPNQQLARRLRFPTPPSFSTLSSKILSLWSASTPLTAQNIGLSYVDADGDRCVLSSDEELQDLYADLRAEARAEEVLKIRVVVLGKEEGGEDGLGERGMEMVEREGEGEETPQAERESERLDGGAQEDKVDVEMQAGPPSPADTVTLRDSESPFDTVADDPEVPELPVVVATAVKRPASPTRSDSMASDPADEFPSDARPPPSSTSDRHPAAPSLLDELTSAVHAFATSSVVTDLMDRLASTKYPTQLTSAVHDATSSLADKATSAQTEIERLLAQVHDELRKNGMTAVDEKLDEVERITRGWTEGLGEKLKEVQKMAEERRAREASKHEAPTKEKAQNAQNEAPDWLMEEEKVPDHQTEAKTTPTLFEGASKASVGPMPGSFIPLPPPAPPAAPAPPSFVRGYSGPHARNPRHPPPAGPPPFWTRHNHPHHHPHGLDPQRFPESKYPRAYPEYDSLLGGFAGRPSHAHGGGFPGAFPTGPAEEKKSSVEPDGQTLERVLDKLNEMGFDGLLQREFVRGMLAASPKAPMELLLSTALTYNLSGPDATYMADGSVHPYGFVHSDAEGRIASMGLHFRASQILHGLMAMRTGLSADELTSRAVQLLLDQK